MPLGPCMGAIVPRAGTVVEIRCFLLAEGLPLALAGPRWAHERGAQRR